MAAPRGTYTPKSGPLAGRTFQLQPGDKPTSPYNRYQQARAQSLGFTGHAEQRRITGISLVQNLIQRAVSVGGMSRNEAISSVRQWYASQDYHGPSKRAGAAHSGAQGARKHNAIRWAMDNGLYDSGDDAADDIPY